MKRVLVLLAGFCVSGLCVSIAQDSVVPSFNPGNKERLDQTKMSLVNALESNSPGLQATAAQTVRELKSLIPDEPFSCMVIPLMRVMKNEQAAVEARILAALALHELHSDKGDFAIKGEAKYSDVKRFQYICAALVAERVKEIQIARQNSAEPQSSAIATAR